MSQPSLQSMVHHIRRITQPEEMTEVSDQNLLERFLDHGDSAAFELLVWRHGRMVWSLCRRMLHNPDDAEDVVQATFLTLVQKASSIGRRQSLGSWLYKVAFRIALTAKTKAGKQAERELLPNDAIGPVDAPEDNMIRQELRLVLHKEINRLPAVQRESFVLCYLEGKTNEEAAQVLGCPVGTIMSRLARARERLRSRLRRRDWAPSVGALTAALMGDMSADAPRRLVATVVRSATLILTDPSVTPSCLSASVVNLMKGELQEMLFAKMKNLTAIVLTLVIVTGLGTVFAQQRLTTNQSGSVSAATSQVPAGRVVARQDALRIQNPFFLLTDESVAKELKLQAGQAQKVRKIQVTFHKKYEPKLKKLDALPFPKEIFEKQKLRSKMVAEINVGLNRDLAALLQPAQIKRLREIDLQEQQLRAFVNPSVVKALKLTATQQKRIKTISDSVNKEIRTELRKSQRKTINIEDAIAVRKKIHPKAMKRILEFLSPNQRTTWRRLIGKPFTRKK